MDEQFFELEKNVLHFCCWRGKAKMCFVSSLYTFRSYYNKIIRGVLPSAKARIVDIRLKAIVLNITVNMVRREKEIM